MDNKKPDYTHCECGQLEDTREYVFKYKTPSGEDRKDFMRQCIKCEKIFDGPYEVLLISHAA